MTVMMMMMIGFYGPPAVDVILGYFGRLRIAYEVAGASLTSIFLMCLIRL